MRRGGRGKGREMGKGRDRGGGVEGGEGKGREGKELGCPLCPAP